MSNDLQQFILYRALRHKFQVESQATAFFFEDKEDGISKNVCAKVSVELSDRLDQIVGILDVSKRSFIERALIHAVETAEAEFHKVLESKWSADELEQMAADSSKGGEV